MPATVPGAQLDLFGAAHHEPCPRCSPGVPCPACGGTGTVTRYAAQPRRYVRPVVVELPSRRRSTR